MTYSNQDTLLHYGIPKMKWGVRRYQDASGKLTEEGKARYRKYAEQARKEIGDASREPGLGMGTGTAKLVRSGKQGKEYRKLEKVVSKESQKAGSEYNKSFKTGKRDQAARDFADAVASTSMQYINDNFSEKDRDKAKAFVYARFIQEQDRAIRKQFGKINS